jgi:hypothetical protein
VASAGFPPSDRRSTAALRGVGVLRCLHAAWKQSCAGGGLIQASGPGYIGVTTGESLDEENTMYYHPHMFGWVTGERTLAACQAVVGVWLDGVARQQQAHAEAFGMYCARQADGLRTVAEAREAGQFAAKLLSCAAPEPHGVAHLSERLAGIIVDTHRKLAELVASYGDEMKISVVHSRAIVETPQKKAAIGGRAARRREAMT